MEKTIFVLSFAILAFLPARAFAVESITNYLVTINVNKDATLNVTESIDYDFGTQYRHGIFRDIPYKYERNSLNYALRISNVTVTDALGQPYQFDESKHDGLFSLKIGDPNSIITGVHSYVISYKVARAINSFQDSDELYWNAIGSQWQVPMDATSVRINLPDDIDPQKVKTGCYRGALGSTDNCQTPTLSYGTVYFQENGLYPNEGVTVVVAWPKGFVNIPSKGEIVFWYIEDNAMFSIPIIGLLVMFGIWYKLGRDPKSRLPISAQYEPPAGLTPIEAGFLLDEHNQGNEISAEIIYLATQGYLKIERIPKTGWLGKDDFKLIRLKHESSLVDHFDRNLMRTLFVLGPDEVLLSTLKKKANIRKDNFSQNSVAKKMVEMGYYDKNPYTVRASYMGVGGFLLFILFYFLMDFLSLPVLVSLLALIGGSMVMGYYMPKKTMKGADTKQLVLGLKEYISVAEKDRLDFHNDPAKDPQRFEKLLPYAIALGVSKQWAQKFEGLFDYHPSWYADPTAASFNAVLFNTQMAGFASGFQTSVLNPPKSAGGGGSGFGGGGSSGGGFGGGGGGSW